MLDFADFVAINKFDRKGAADALRDVRKQYQRNREAFAQAPDEMPVFGTIAARFNDDGVTALYQALARAAGASTGLKLAPGKLPRSTTSGIRPRQNADRAAGARALPRRDRRDGARLSRLGEGAGEDRARAAAAQGGAGDARRDDGLHEDSRQAGTSPTPRRAASSAQRSRAPSTRWSADRRAREAARPARAEAARHVAGDQGRLRRRRIRGEDPRQGDPHRAHHDVALRHARAEGRAAAVRGRRRDPALAARARTCPARFPFTAGVFAFKRENEDPTRMFAGEGDAFRTNRRFHLLADGMPAKRLSTAFDSVTLYGNDPGSAPRHLRQGRQLGRLDRHARRHEGALLGLRPLRAEQLGVDDDQRPGADDPGDVHEHRDRPAARQVPRRQRPRADRRRGGEDQRRGRSRPCAARCRPTS